MASTCSYNTPRQRQLQQRHLSGTSNSRGHVVVFGDSNCLDSSHQRSNCYDFLVRILEHVTEGHVNGIAPDSARLKAPYEKQGFVPPQRRPDVDFSGYSWVLTHDLKCYANTHCAYHSCAAPWEPARPSAFMQGRGTWAGAAARASDTSASDAATGGRTASEAKAEDVGMVGSGGSGNQGGLVGGVGGKGGDPGRGAGEGGSVGEGTPSAQQQQQQQQQQQLGSQIRQGNAPSLEHATPASVGTGMGMGSLTALVCVVCVVGLVGVFGLYRFRRRPPSRAVIKGPLI
ncbi:hypothetical protein DUNSADRAFT_2450 [Dunaliella salina]|uniref:MBTPS1 fourth domain-containing protein n=1 Tax=Dunaliella salina TaxID=3046 RepID=A0ABQ7FWA8_DUNSA|nr:hypothetical protein DUNSADRAFT_2450 [Dunaliella salina]|eukprot:KAF5826649.1 hypothetical protein DUNSADRAFT_2450 [Dunaliella salina]